MILTPSPVHPALAHGESVPRLSGIDAAGFERQFAVPNRPVILTDVMSRWAALEKWTPEYFLQRFPERKVAFKYGGMELAMREFIPQVLASTPEHPAPYLTNLPLRESFPELMEEIQPLPPQFRANWATRRFLHRGVRRSLNRGSLIELYIGGPGGSFPVLHYDGLSTHAFLMQVHGVKQYWLWPPADSEFMYPGEPRNLSPVRNVDSPDLVTYPLFAKAHASTLTLHPGEMLFVPSRWWHTAKMLSPSITLSVNTLHKSNWRSFRDELTHRTRGLAWVTKSSYLLLERFIQTAQDFAGMS